MASFTLSVLVLILAIGGKAQASTVILTPPEFAAIRGTFSFNCTAQGVDNGATVQEFKWYHNQTEIKADVSTSRFSIVRPSGSNSSILIVTSAKREDGGEYYCEVLLSGNINPVNSSSHMIHIVGIFSVIPTEAVYEVVLGSRIEVRCIIDADPPAATLTWRRVINGVASTNPYVVQHRTTSGPSFGILEKTVTVEDNGDWSCHASDVFGGLDRQFSILVLVPPSDVTIIAQRSNPLVIMRNEDIRLECNADGNPAPNFTWTYNGTTGITELSQTSGSRYTVETQTRGHSVLTVSGASYRDDGTYTCIATNKAGTDSTSINVEIQGAPEILINQSSSQIRVSKYSDKDLDCPFRSNPPATSVKWWKGSTQLQSEDQYQIFNDNGTLHIRSFATAGAVNFTCKIANEFGSENRTFIVLVQDIPAPPTNFEFQVRKDDNRTITLTWTESVQMEPANEVEDYVVEQSINGGDFQLSDYVFESNATSGVLSDLLPGMTYVFRLRATNLAGLSQPSNNLTYMPPPTSPMLSYFTVSALEGGRSVLLEWELAYDGGHQLTEFTVEIMLENSLVDSKSLNVSLGSYVVTGLKHDASYQFLAVLINAAGRNGTFTGGTNTTVAPPSKPTKPVIAMTTTSSIKISFSVESGTQPITHFLLNITVTKSGAELQKRFPIDEIKYIDSLKDVVNPEGDLIGYDVEMVVTGLKEREVYQFEVAAESSIGVGEFSEPSDNARLEDDRILYYIVAGVVGGMLAVVIPIAILALFCYGKQKYNQRKKTITINSNGSHAFDTEDIDNAYALKATTPSIRQHSRETLASTTNGYFGNGHIQSSISKSKPYDREKAVSSPPYNRLGESPLPSGMMSPIGIKTDSVIDMPSENGTVVQTYFAGGKVAYNPQYNHHVPAQHSPRPQHVQLQLQTSFNDLQRHTESPSPPERYPASLMSEKQFLSNSHLLNIPGTSLSRSNPTISSRYSCDSMLVPPAPTSQATDV